MSIPHTSGPLRSHTPIERFRSRKHRRAVRELASRNLNLVSVNTGVPVGLASNNATLMLVAVEDLCWQLGMRELKARRPAFWRRAARAEWKAERVRWEEKRARLAELANEAVSEL